MEEKQKEIYEMLMDLASKVQDGAFGKDNDLDFDVLEDDINNIIDNL